MVRVLLINQATIPHFRVPIYSYLHKYLKDYGFEFVVISSGIQSGNPHPVDFQFSEMPLSVFNLANLIVKEKIDIIISWVDLKHLYLFPTYFMAKILGRKMIYWGQGGDLLDRDSKIKKLAYLFEQAICDGIILYAEHLKQYVPSRFHHKVFIANNTLCIDYPGLFGRTKQSVLQEHGIYTKRNIICVGRMQKRKRLDHLVAAHRYMNRPDVGLIFVGPDSEGILKDFDGKNIYKLGPVYGNKKFDLLSAADVYCLPGAVGLSIVDAFHCGLPFITEDGDESAEIMYLKDGVNGYVVPRGNIQEMAHKVQLLLDNDALREKFSAAAIMEIKQNGNIENLCKGFKDALLFVAGNTS
jgi:glycosyltransferase involved in cell wall biosynthesis